MVGCRGLGGRDGKTFGMLPLTSEEFGGVRERQSGIVGWRHSLRRRQVRFRNRSFQGHFPKSRSSQDVRSIHVATVAFPEIWCCITRQHKIPNGLAHGSRRFEVNVCSQSLSRYFNGCLFTALCRYSSTEFLILGKRVRYIVGAALY